MAVIAFVTSIILIFGGSSEQAERIAGVILQGATLLAYCIGEGFADGKGAEQNPLTFIDNRRGDDTVVDDEDKYWDEEDE